MSAYSTKYISRERAEQMMISKLSSMIAQVNSMGDEEIERFLDQDAFLENYCISFNHEEDDEGY